MNRLISVHSSLSRMARGTDTSTSHLLMNEKKGIMKADLQRDVIVIQFIENGFSDP